VCSDLTSKVAAGGYEQNDIPTHKLIQQGGGVSVFQSTDASSEDDVKKLIETTVENYGRVDM
jgi:NAD(P)-dependent dehydrogenase (short-subunit alcohol dehydrogenase family)